MAICRNCQEILFITICYSSEGGQIRYSGKLYKKKKQNLNSTNARLTYSFSLA